MSTSINSVSMRELIEGLDVGETYSRAQRFDADQTMKDTPPEALRTLRLSTQATVHRVSQSTGNVYTIEGGEFLTSSRDVMVVLCVTRTA